MPSETTGTDEIALGDIGPSTQWSRALKGVDAVIHLAGRVHVMREKSADSLARFREVNVAGSERLARSAATMGVRRLVYVSTIGVHGKNSAAGALTESDALAPYSAYTTSKLEAELALAEIARQSGLELTIVRPPLVYGPNTPGNFLRLLKLVAMGIPLPLASVDNRRSMIYVENLADALLTCAVKKDAAGEIYLVTDTQDSSTPQLVRILAGLLGVPCRLWPFPPAFLRMAGTLTGTYAQVSPLIESLAIDSSRIQKQLGWTPPFSREQGLEDTARWFRSRRH